MYSYTCSMLPATAPALTAASLIPGPLKASDHRCMLRTLYPISIFRLTSSFIATPRHRYPKSHTSCSAASPPCAKAKLSRQPYFKPRKSPKLEAVSRTSDTSLTGHIRGRFASVERRQSSGREWRQLGSSSPPRCGECRGCSEGPGAPPPPG